MKKNISLSAHVNTEIRVGDKVKLIDGSALAYKGDRSLDKNLYIVNAYPELFKSQLKIEDMPFTVKEVSVVDRATYGGRFENVAYLTDIVVEFNNVQLYTASKFVKKIEFNFGDKVLVVNGGAGAFGADGRVGILIDPQSVTYAVEDNYIRGASYPENSKNPVIKINDKEYWRLCKGYELKLIQTREQQFRQKNLNALHNMLVIGHSGFGRSFPFLLWP